MLKGGLQFTKSNNRAVGSSSNNNSNAYIRPVPKSEFDLVKKEEAENKEKDRVDKEYNKYFGYNARFTNLQKSQLTNFAKEIGIEAY
jgi:hypothetical protein